MEYLILACGVMFTAVVMLIFVFFAVAIICGIKAVWRDEGFF